MSSTLNNFIKYSFTIRISIQILYEFRTRKTLDLLRINDFDLFISKTKIVAITDYSVTRNVTITMYLIVIRNATAETSPAKETPLINQRKISSPRVIISIRLSTFFIKKLISRQTITFKTTFSAKETPFIAIPRIVIINEYRPSHIDTKNAIVFISLKMKKVYDTRHQFIFFKVENLINLRLHKNYKISIITSKKIKL